MNKKMLIDATQSEETRVAIVAENRLEDFDFESKVIQQIKGNIYLVKVTRVEPSLQAAFFDYKGNRHGFLPFSEIHPDYFRIPIADRQKLIEQERAELEARAKADLLDDEDEDEDVNLDNPTATDEESEAPEESKASNKRGKSKAKKDKKDKKTVETAEELTSDENSDEDEDDDFVPAPTATDIEDDDGDDNGDEKDNNSDQQRQRGRRGRRGRGRRFGNKQQKKFSRPLKQADGDSVDEDVESAKPRFRISHRQYKIQEVIKRNQIMLVQITKEERGNKGAAATTYISLPGRYCVLMPNSTHGGGVSRKISNPKDRRTMKELLRDLNVPEGMSVILRTAGIERTKLEIKRDLDYLLRLWDNIRETTMKSTAPAAIYKEGDLIQRSIRDLYSKDISELVVAGDDGYKQARDFMKMLMPSHVRRIKQYKEEKIPLFHRYQVEKQVEEIFSPNATMPSGGYIVIHPTEALVSVDVNSGKSTRERHIEGTALQTNLEAAEEVARQLRLRDLGGLVVVDFIDMEDYRNNRTVERRMREVLKQDRARVQITRISDFGLMEISRQRLRPSLVETNFVTCHHCQGTGLLRTVETAALVVLRGIEEEGIRGRYAECSVKMQTEVALYILNHKRQIFEDIERRHNFRVLIQVDPRMVPGEYDIQKIKLANGEDDSDGVIDATAVEADDSAQEPADKNQASEKQSNSKQEDKRGRRGRGRNRHNDRDNNGGNNQKSERNEQAEQSQLSEGAENNTEQRPAATKEQPPKATRRVRRGAHKKGAQDKNLDVTASENKAEDAVAEEKEKPKTRKRARVQRGTKTAENESEKNKAESKGETDAGKAVEKGQSKDKKEPQTTRKSANDSKSAADGNTENDSQNDSQTSDKRAPRKRGWWKRITT